MDVNEAWALATSLILTVSSIDDRARFGDFLDSHRDVVLHANRHGRGECTCADFTGWDFTTRERAEGTPA